MEGLCNVRRWARSDREGRKEGRKEEGVDVEVGVGKGLL